MARTFNPILGEHHRVRNGWRIAIFMAILFISLGVIPP
jgi:hypothetical protein